MLKLLLILALLNPGDGEEDQYIRRGGDLAASHILVAYKGADKAPEDVTRSKAEAERKARKLTAEVLADPSRFEALAREHSDGITAAASGNLGSFRKGEMDRAFEVAVARLENGGITSEPVRTPFGFHIIRREPMLVKRFAARMILLSHVEATSVTGLKEDAEGKTRSRADAKALAEELHRSDAIFEDLAEAHTDLNRIFLGVSAVGDGDFTDWVISKLEKMAYGERSAIEDHKFGYVILERVKVERRNGSMILIEHMDADKASDAAIATRREALELATKLIVQLKAKPKKFEKLARKHSGDASARIGGKLAPWYVGARPRIIEQAFTSMDKGAISGEPVEGPRGFYILRRD